MEWREPDFQSWTASRGCGSLGCVGVATLTLVFADTRNAKVFFFPLRDGRGGEGRAETERKSESGKVGRSPRHVFPADFRHCTKSRVFSICHRPVKPLFMCNGSELDSYPPPGCLGSAGMRSRCPHKCDTRDSDRAHPLNSSRLHPLSVVYFSRRVKRFLAFRSSRRVRFLCATRYFLAYCR